MRFYQRKISQNSTFADINECEVGGANVVIRTVPIQRAPIYVHVMLGITRLEYYVQVLL